MTSIDPKTYTAPCGADFDTEQDARDHEALCDQCAGATEAHETADEMSVTYGACRLCNEPLGNVDHGHATDLSRTDNPFRHTGQSGNPTALKNPTHETVTATFDQTHANNRATIGDIFEMVEDVLDRRDIETARELMADARLLMDANARIEACWTVKA